MTKRTGNGSKKPRVALLSPPIDRSGGIGTLYTYALPYLRQYADVTVIDTRGYGKNAWTSIFPFSRAITHLTVLKLSRKVDVVHVNLGSRGAAYRKLSAVFVASRLLRIPCIAQLHSSSFDAFFDHLPNIGKRWVARNLHRCRRILVLGTKWQTLMMSISALDDMQVTVLPMGVPDLLEASESESRLASNQLAPQGPAAQSVRYALFAGELGERKGLPQLIQSLALPGTDHMRVIIAGAGDLHPWKQLARTLGVESKCVFLGLVPPTLIHMLMKLCDSVVLASRAEGLPVSVLEALSAKCLVIATPAGALGEYVHHDVDVHLLESNSADAIAHAFTLLLDSERTCLLTRRGRETWSNNFDVVSTSRVLADVWSSVARDSSSLH